MTCYACGNEIGEDFRFCTVCGADQSKRPMPVAEPVTELIAESVAAPIVEPIAETATEPAAESVADVAAEPVSEPVEEPIAEPVAEPAEEPIAEPVSEPVEEPVAEPVAEPAPAVQYPAYQPQQQTYQPQYQAYQPQQQTYQPQYQAYQSQQQSYQPQYQAYYPQQQTYQPQYQAYQPQYQAYQPQQQAYQAPAQSAYINAKPALQLPTGRGLAKMIFLGLITGTLYNQVIMSRIAEEINIVASRHDGKRTQQYLWVPLLCVVTLGIYAFIWMHGLCNRIGNELTRRGVNYKFRASTFWLWNILGSLILVGPFIFTFKMMKAMNKLNENYNLNG